MGSSVLNQQPQRTLATELSALEVQVLTSPEELYALEREWGLLAQESPRPNIFLTWEWITAWWEAFARGGPLWILTAREKGRLVGVAPFVLRNHPLRGGPFRELSLLGSAVASGDHLGVLASSGYEETVAARFVEVLQAHQRSWDILALDYVTADTPLVTQLLQHAAQPALVWETLCPYLQLPQCWEDYQVRLTKKKRDHLRRRTDRLARDYPGGVEFHQVDSAEELTIALEELFRLHQAVRAKHGDRGVFCDPRVCVFHRQVAERFLAKAWLRFYLMQVDRQTTAVFYGFRYQNTVSFYQSGYDLSWGRYSPGEAIMAHAIRRSIEEKAWELDLLRGAEPYKAEWTTTARRNLRIRLATTRRGSLLVQGYRTTYAARRLLRRWRGREADWSRFSDQ